jgi:1L-myo-inositol 1-phosphate cytidylyltransferase / CDP-L-myo-inositol myo-inositolphosphotransferase
MALLGLLTATSPRDDALDVARAWLKAGGQSLMARNIRLLRRVGTERILVYAGSLAGPGGDSRLVELRRDHPDVEVVLSGPDLAARVEADDTVLLMEEGVVIDERILAAVVPGAAPHAIAVWPADGVHGTRAVRLDPIFSFASVIRTKGETVRSIARGLGDWDLTQTLVRTALGSGQAQLVDMSAQPGPELVWQPIAAGADEESATETLLDGGGRLAQRPHWPEQLLYARPQSWFAEALAPTAVTPLHLAIGLGVAGLTAIIFAALGWRWPSLLIMLLLPLLMGGARLLGVVRAALPPRWDALANQAVLSGLCLWLLAFGYGLGTVSLVCAFWLISLLLSEAALPAVAANTAKGWSDRLDPLTASWSTLPITLLPFALLGWWQTGVIAMTAHGVISWALLLRRQRRGQAAA